MPLTMSQAFIGNFLGNSPKWYKIAILSFLIINPILFFYVSPFVAGWVLVLEFIFTLAMALKCYPLQPGGLLAIEAVAIGMTSANQVLHEIEANLEVLLLLVFMVAGIYFMKQLLLFAFTKIITKVRSKILVSLMFCLTSAFLSAFLDALTVIAVIIAVAVGFYAIYHKVASGKDFSAVHDHTSESNNQLNNSELESFRGFLRNLLMHAGVGTALGGVCTMVGEPQNLIIAAQANWQFGEFVVRMSPVTVPVLIAGILTCLLVEKFRIFGYGAKLPDAVHKILCDYAAHEDAHRTNKDKMKLVIQVLVGVWLIAGLALHLASVGLVGLSVIILTTAFNGITDEHALGKAFEEALPFTALLAVFFAVVAVIIDQHLFAPVIQWALSYEGNTQLVIFYIANGLLSMVSDNVFVGTVYINEVKAALIDGQITRDQFDLLAVAINTGTNLPSVATPNGQAAFLFLLTSALAPLIRLSYGRMVWMALPYTIVLSVVGVLAIETGFLEQATQYFYDSHMIFHHSAKDVIAPLTSH
ncbi:sodium/proton antiporter NhaB [Shewanella sp. JNE10-2]|jgi:NhaB family Na+:H+ antiporter|uniref:sodium/proton antiporter NhaB n=1 Tax=unclassified Shewanella TaxID=196818 RepID=UPI0020056E54|nr:MULTISPECIES: sodium/proton antiporter NhaB [unclassified Shewanella]MCK7628569.1 sodium/proton antiporter NhaB [Shewanella sp. JNE9-1]MCK7633170.1 sodium/proton antiporter NhaB [Shewanella sp. JNE17]MCK7643819.1 sodium/proton antiporter NhaB [Shewanella sp. JNE3-1]MCK7648230.1 sodium/proton antiporter NhaB [Shewanella sp. JNE8]MCK7651873.1 sodium/proton antiporter NhaB [Shewanella sp. JNE4-1]